MTINRVGKCEKITKKKAFYSEGHPIETKQRNRETRKLAEVTLDWDGVGGMCKDYVNFFENTLSGKKKPPFPGAFQHY